MEEKLIVKLEADIADLKNQLGVAQAELKKFGLGVQNTLETITLDRLNAQLSQLQKQLGATDIGSAAFKNIGNEIIAVEGKINSALNSINTNANRSKTGFNGLSNSINQLSRELPAFAINANIGFLAISNNLPILFDEIKKITAANKELAASGNPTTSVFKQLTGALFSWQTALSVGVTLLTVYGGKIYELISTMVQGKEQISKVKFELDALNDTYSDKSLQNAIGDVVLLKSSLETASKSINGQKQFVEQYNRTIGTVTGSVDTFAAAEQGIINNTDNYISAMIARVTATKLAAKAGDITTQIEDLKLEHAKQNAIDQIDLQKEYSDKYKKLLYTGSLELKNAFGNEENYVKTMIANKKAITHKGQQEELAALKTQYDNLEKLTKKYYDKSGTITPYVKPKETKTERPLDMTYIAPKIGIKSLVNDTLKLDQNLKGVKTTLKGFENLKPLRFLEDYQIQNLENVVNLLGNALTSAFDAALISGENFFKVLGQALLNLFKKLLAAAAAAAILSLLLAPLGYGSAVTGFVPLFKQLGGFDLSGGKKPDNSMVAMPTNTLGQGGYQIDIMGDKMRLLLDNNAIKNSRVV